MPVRSALLVVLLLALSAACSPRDGSEPALRVDAAELKAMIDAERDDFVLIDTRTQKEFDGGHIRGARLIPYDEISRRAPEIPRDTLVVLYCRTGRRSGIAARELRKLGYDNVVNFGGVKTDWPYELERAEGAPVP
jgi:rhodanese-related sulfurtransferase